METLDLVGILIASLTLSSTNWQKMVIPRLIEHLCALLVISYVRGISVKFRQTGNHFNIRTVFKTKRTLHGALMIARPYRDIQDMRQCVYYIPCECGRCYFGETSRLLGVHIKEHKHNLRQGLMEK
jgi:hypothetical protein